MKSSDQAIGGAHRPKVCVIFPGALGDFICFLPALQFLLRDAEVDLFAHSEFAGIVPAGATVRALECSAIARLFAVDVAQDLRGQNVFAAYRAVYSWMGSQQPTYVAQLQKLSSGRARILPFRPTGSTEHQADYYLRCVTASPLNGWEPKVECSTEAISWRDQFWKENALDRRTVLALAPGSGAREKNWPEEFFLAIADWWRESVGGAVVLLVGPVEAERGGVDRLWQNCLVAQQLNLSQVAALLSRSDVYLGNDSGISHLAAAVGARTLALFGPSDPRQWSPRGPKVSVISRQIACSPCPSSVMKSCPHRACLAELYPQKVIEIMTRLPELATLTRGGVGITV